MKWPLVFILPFLIIVIARYFYLSESGKEVSMFPSRCKFFREIDSNGNFKEYYPSGKLKIVGRYLNDGPDGHFKAYSEDGKLISEFDAIKGKQNGETKWYYKNGDLHKLESFDMGVLKQRTTFDEQGNVISKEDFREQRDSP